MWIEIAKLVSKDGVPGDFYVKCDICGTITSSTELFTSDKTRCKKCGAYHKGIRYAPYNVTK